MKDFWDVRFLIKEFDFDGALLQKAIRATFAARQTSVPQTFPTALTDTFAENASTAADWTAFIKRSRITSDTDFLAVLESLRGFFRAAHRGGSPKCRLRENLDGSKRMGKLKIFSPASDAVNFQNLQ